MGLGLGLRLGLGLGLGLGSESGPGPGLGLGSGFRLGVALTLTAVGRVPVDSPDQIPGRLTHRRIKVLRLERPEEPRVSRVAAPIS